MDTVTLVSMKDLRVSYLDLYLVHWPFPNYHAPGCDGDSRNPDSRPFSVTEFLNTWRQCEALVEEGRVKYIGMGKKHAENDHICTAFRRTFCATGL